MSPVSPVFSDKLPPLLHPLVVDLRGEFHHNFGTSALPFLPLMNTWTYQMREGPPGGTPHVTIQHPRDSINIFQLTNIW